MVTLENPCRSAVYEILRPIHLTPTITLHLSFIQKLVCKDVLTDMLKYLCIQNDKHDKTNQLEKQTHTMLITSHKNYLKNQDS